MKPFKYLQPEKIEEASKLLGNDWKTSLLLAGGSDLYGMIKHEIVSPENVVNLKSLKGMREIREESGKGLILGALVTISDLAENELIVRKYPVLSQAAQEVASPQLRNMGTLGGNLCQRPRCWYFRGEFHCLRKSGDICYAVDGENKYHCIIGGSPCFIVHPSDTAVALTALDARLTIHNGKKSRQVPIGKFFVLPEENVLRENILQPGEILTEIFIPEPVEKTRSTYIKIKERGAWDFAIVSIAAQLSLAGSTIRNGKLAIGGVAPIPWTEKNVNTMLTGMDATEANIQKIAEEILKDSFPMSQNQYKLFMVRNLVKRTLTDLTAL